ncbi:unnamed protein product [Symbiodinium sp. CCMP2592]|nr:unnamed protein product [Symbiodinium sp. CCMP2592]
MGKRGQWPTKDYADYDGSWSQSGWDGWQDPRQPKGKSRGKNKDAPRKPKEDTAFPTYEEITLPGKSTGKGRGTTSSGSKDQPAGPNSMAKNVQKAVNNLRRCENKIRRLDEETAETQEKWQEFQAQLKKSFITERARFHTNMSRLSTEKSEQVALQEEAVEVLQHVLDGTVPDAGPTEEQPPAEAQAAWDELMQEAEEADDLSGILSGAMHDKILQNEGTRRQLLHLLQRHRRREQTLATSTPPKRPRTAAPPTPADKASAPRKESLVKDTTTDAWWEGARNAEPYVTSPSTRTTGPDANLASERPPSRPRTSTPRAPVKARTKPSPVNTSRRSLAEKLEDSRAAAADIGMISLDSEDDLLDNLANKGDTEPPREGDFVWHGPPGGHDQVLYSRASAGRTPSDAPPQADQNSTWLVFDLYDIAHILGDYLYSDLHRGVHNYGMVAASTLGRTLALVLMGAQLVILTAHLRWHRPFAARWTTSRATWVRMLLVFSALLVPAAAVSDQFPARAPLPECRPGRLRRLPPAPFWQSGTPTAREQLAHALQREALSRPLMSGGVHPPNVHPDGPTVLHVPPEPIAPDFHEPEDLQPWTDDEPEHTTHISFRLLSPFIEAESVDIGMMFPLHQDRVLEFVRESSRYQSRNWLDHAVFTIPQLHEDYGSVLVFPSWVTATTTKALVIDASAARMGVFAFYHAGPISRQDVLNELLEDDDNMEDFVVYALGDTSPLVHGSTITPPQGGVFKVLHVDQHIQWASLIEERFDRPERWRPDTDHLEHQPGKHIFFQYEDMYHLHRVSGPHQPTPDLVAATAFARQLDEIWLRAPTQRPEGLYWRGHRVHSLIAVIDERTHPKQEYHVVHLDLRGIGLWPRWVAVEGRLFHPGDCLEQMNIEYVEGFSLVVKGGKKEGNDGWIRIRDGDLIEVYLRLTEELTPTSQPSSGENDSSSDGTDNLPDTPDEDSPPPPNGPGPFGPPRPEPVNRPRSRSPRRDPTETTEVCLAACLAPPVFNLDQEVVQLPHLPTLAGQLTQTWAPTWLQFDLTCLPLKEITIQATRDLIHWALLLASIDEAVAPNLHIYSDGSYDPHHGLGGYGVAALLEHQGQWALYGLLGDGTQGNVTSPWTTTCSPALFNEQAGLMVVLLWLVQSRGFICFNHITVHFDCMAAGLAADGSASATNGLAPALRALQHFTAAALGQEPRFSHVRAHQGEPYNELVDVVAKAAAAGNDSIPRPPPDLCRLVQSNDLSWLAASVDPSWTGILPINLHGLQWQMQDDFGPSPLQATDLIPTSRPATTGTSTTEFQTVLFSLNAQGLGGKERYFEDQLDKMGVNIAMFQETKSKGGLCQSARFLRLSTNSDRHWGVAIWLSRTRGIGSFGDSPCTVEEADIHLLAQTNRLLALQITKGGHHFVVIAGHCPHEAKLSEARLFLQDLATLLNDHKHSCLVFAGLDLNGRPRLGSLGVTGSLHFGEDEHVAPINIPRASPRPIGNIPTPTRFAPPT